MGQHHNGDENINLWKVIIHYVWWKYQWIFSEFTEVLKQTIACDTW